MSNKSTISESELDRLLALSNLGIDFYESKNGIKRLTAIAAQIAGTEICQINLIDSFTQWTISAVGTDQKQIPIENSICKHTLKLEPDAILEIADLSKDDRFSEQPYVKGKNGLRYYLGVPLTTVGGFHIGALCVMDKNLETLSDEKKEMLKLIADQVVERLQTNKLLLDLSKEIKELTITKNKLAHDIRGPVGGIIGLSEVVLHQGDDNTFEEMMSFFSLISTSGKSIMDLTDSILNSRFDVWGNKKNNLAENEIHLVGLKKKVEQLCAPQALLKKLNLEVSYVPNHEFVPFNKHLVFQIIGNLVSNSIKFTPENGSLDVSLELEVQEDETKRLYIKVKDTGVGISDSKIRAIFNSNSGSELGTDGEKGYGLGLNLVKVLLEKLDGKMEISSQINQGTEFRLEINVG